MFLRIFIIVMALVCCGASQRNTLAATRPIPINTLSPTNLPRVYCEVRNDGPNRLVRVGLIDGEIAVARDVSLPQMRERMRKGEKLNRAKLRRLRAALRECRAGFESAPPESPSPPDERDPDQNRPDDDDRDPPFDDLPEEPTPDGPAEPTAENCIDAIDNDLDDAVDDEDTDCQNLGRTFYLSATLGNDAWSGLLPSPSQDGTDGPKQTLQAANALLRTVAEPGDRVLMRRGDTWVEHAATTPPLSLGNIEGEAQAPILLGSYGTGAEKPTLDIGGSTGAIINVTGSTRYIVVRDLRLTTTAPLGQRPQGINVLDCSGNERPEHVVFDSLVIENLRYGVTLQSNHLTLKNSVIRNNFKSGDSEQGGHTQGLYVGKQCNGGNFITVNDNVFDNNGAMESVFDWNAYLSCIDCSFERNRVMRGSAGLKLRNCINITVRDNLFEDISSVGISMGSDNERPAENILIERNVVRRTVDGITITRQSTGHGVVKNVRVLNNLLLDNLPRPNGGGDYNGYFLYSANEPRENVLIAHNTFYNIRYKSPLTFNFSGLTESPPQPQVDVRIVNNLIHGADPAYPAMQFRGDTIAPIAIDYNLYDTHGVMKVAQGATYQTLNQVQQQFPEFEQHGKEGQAQLLRVGSTVGDLVLLDASSDAVDQAQCLGEVAEDYFEAARPSQSCDIGYEERPTP